MSHEITVREVEPKDFWNLWAVMEEMHADNAVFPLARNKAQRWVAETCARPDAWVFIAEMDGEITGTFAVGISTAAYSDTEFLQDNWIFVRPRFRMTRTIFRLIRAVRELERAKGLPVHINIVSPTQAARKVAFFKRYFCEVGHVQPMFNGNKSEHENLVYH